MAVDYSGGMIAGFAILVAATFIYVVGIIVYWWCKVRPDELKAVRAEASGVVTASSNKGFHILEEEETGSAAIQLEEIPVATQIDVEEDDNQAYIEPDNNSDTKSNNSDIPEEVLAFNENARLGEGSIGGSTRDPDTFKEDSPVPFDGKEGDFLVIDSHSHVKRRGRSLNEVVPRMVSLFESSDRPVGRIEKMRHSDIPNHGDGYAGNQTQSNIELTEHSKDELKDDMGEPLYSQLSLNRKKSKSTKTVTFREPGGGHSDAISVTSDPPDLPDRAENL